MKVLAKIKRRQLIFAFCDRDRQIGSGWIEIATSKAIGALSHEHVLAFFRRARLITGVGPFQRHLVGSDGGTIVEYIGGQLKGARGIRCSVRIDGCWIISPGGMQRHHDPCCSLAQVGDCTLGRKYRLISRAAGIAAASTRCDSDERNHRRSRDPLPPPIATRHARTFDPTELARNGMTAHLNGN